MKNNLKILLEEFNVEITKPKNCKIKRTQSHKVRVKYK